MSSSNAQPLPGGALNIGATGQENYGGSNNGKIFIPATGGPMSFGPWDMIVAGERVSNVAETATKGFGYPLADWNFVKSTSAGGSNVEKNPITSLLSQPLTSPEANLRAAAKDQKKNIARATAAKSKPASIKRLFKSIFG